MHWERTVEASAEVAAGPLWEVLLDGRRWSAWNPGVEWMVVEGPLRTGTIVTLKPRRLPQTALRIEAVIPERLLALLVTFGPVAAMRLRWELAPREGRTMLRHAVAIDGPLAGPLLRRAAEKISAGASDTLERLIKRARPLPDALESDG